ncbi:zinc finger protein 687a isoform X2 [Triplophysa dalaica]|uniref:zinc finger protein 687a isoform X2 n=1 Tax=Triplophysa dalaica TaxID=1582913 RepID=UPI0024DFD7F8|nr:zinc finger protein 687a isoform X2 [Triplophysa dalaica]
MGMGDMKTPDFDDLLAAFDIPDIDANEAIQSDTDGNHNEPSDVSGKERSGSPSLRPIVSPESPVPSAPHNDPSVVSVIVKNSVRPDRYVDDDDDKMEGNLSEDFSGADRAVDGSPQQAATVPLDPLIYNGLQAGSVGDSLEPCPAPSLTQMQPNRQLWSASECIDDNQDGTSSKNSDSTFPPHQSLSSPLPLLLSPHLIGPHPKLDAKEAQCSALNGALRTGVRRHLSDDEESEPDLGSPPLIIQESPDSQMCSAPKVPRRNQSHLSALQPCSPSSPALPISNTQMEESAPLVHQSASLQINISKTSVTSGNEPPTEEKHLEHIIEERDSPESPEPEIPFFCQVSSVSEKPQVHTPLASNQQGIIETEQKKEEGAPEDQLIDMSLSLQEREKSVHHSNMKKDGAEDADIKAKLVDAGSSKPLKVRIKTVKTSTGNITRSVSKVASKGAGSLGASKGSDGSKVPAGVRKSVQRIQKSSAASMLPVSTLQDASTAMLFAASKAQNKMAATLSATAVNITRTSTLPSVSSLSATSSSMTGMNIRSLGQKIMNGNPGTAKPASIVNSPGAVISRSQSSLVEAFNKILNSKNPLPSYQPDLSTPPAEWGLRLPSTGYRCLECGDAFALERSLARHYDRRSMRIEVTCNHCSKRLAFFNKCSLLLHAREHKEKGLVMQCSHLVMSPVSMEQMIGQQDTVAKGSSLLPAIKESTVQLSQSTENCCPECWSPFKGKAEIAAHFQEVEPGGADTCCMQCSPPMPLWNSCSAAAHRRLHQQRSPLVCPECGVTCQLQNLNTHLNQSCMHYSRRLGYRCPCCHLVFGGVNSLNAVKTHMQTAHCEVFHKCPSCPMAFKAPSGAETHCISQHPELPETARQSKEIYKCVMCRTVFTQKALLSVHFDTHLAKQKMSVFKCPDCNKLFTQRGPLLEHIKVSHRASRTQYDAKTQRSLVKMESSDGEEWGREEEEDRGGVRREAEVSKAPDVQGWSCTKCQTRYTAKENYITHMSEEHGEELKKFPCTLCERSFSSSSSLRRHIRVKHKGIKRTFYCQMCKGGKRSFSSKLILEKHIQAEHRGPANQSQAVHHITDPADSSSEQDGGPSTLGEAESRVAESRVPATEDQEAAGFRCMPCGFATEDKEEFLQHIACHRGEGGSAFQCQQCGACFASASSLSRHLFISHRVRNVPAKHAEVSPGTGSAPGNVTSDPAGSPGSPSSTGGSQVEDGEGKHTCKVCGRFFTKPADLNTHFRTHGMAFITTYKSDKPA